MASRLPAHARIVATDLNQPMLDYASQTSPRDDWITWRQANALTLPFEDEAFDVIACQFGVMFFPNKLQAYRETHRTLKPGGTSFSTCGIASRLTTSPMSSRKHWQAFFQTTHLSS